MHPSRTLPAHLARLDDDALTALVAARLPGMTVRPGTLGVLAYALAEPASLRHALRALDRWCLDVLGAVADPRGAAVTREHLAERLPGAPDEAVDAALDRLAAAGLAWPVPPEWLPLAEGSSSGEAGPSPAGGPVWQAPPAASGLVRGRTRLGGAPGWTAPDLPLGPADADERGAAGQVVGAVTRVDAVLRAADAAPLAQVQTGGLAVKDVRRGAKELGLTPDEVAAAVQLALDARLLAPGARGVEPTDAWPAWQDESLAARAARLTVGWIGSGVPLAACGVDRGRTRPLDPTLEVRPVRRLRREVLVVAAGRPVQLDAAAPALAWHRPLLLTGDADDLVGLQADADLLGLTLGGRLTAPARTASAALADGVTHPGEVTALVARAWRDLLPPEVDRVLLGPDLTAVVPGQPSPALRALLDVSSDAESSGGAVARRFTRSSVGRALDAGWEGDALLEAFAAHADRVPGGMEALVGDVVRGHGRVRVHPVAAVLVCADDALAHEVAGDRALRAAALRRVAPTVLVSPTTPPAALLAQLRAAGHLPVLDAGEGRVVVTGGSAGGRGQGRPSAPAPAALGPEVLVPWMAGQDAAELVQQMVRQPDAAPGPWSYAEPPYAEPPDAEPSYAEPPLDGPHGEGCGCGGGPGRPDEGLAPGVREELQRILAGALRVSAGEGALLLEHLEADLPVRLTWGEGDRLRSATGWVVSLDERFLSLEVYGSRGDVYVDMGQVVMVEEG